MQPAERGKVIQANQRWAKEKPKRKFPRLSLGTVFIIAFLIYWTMTFLDQQQHLDRLNHELQNIEQEKQTWLQKEQSLKEYIRYLHTDEYIEKTAREKLGYIMPGEIPYITLEEKEE